MPSRTIKAVGISRNMSVDEAIRNAIANLPAVAPNSTQNIEVGKIKAQTGGVVGSVLSVEIKSTVV